MSEEVAEQVEVPTWHLHMDSRTNIITVTHLVCGAVSPDLDAFEDGVVEAWIVAHEAEPHD